MHAITMNEDEDPRKEVKREKSQGGRDTSTSKKKSCSIPKRKYIQCRHRPWSVERRPKEKAEADNVVNDTSDIQSAIGPNKQPMLTSPMRRGCIQVEVVRMRNCLNKRLHQSTQRRCLQQPAPSGHRQVQS